MGNSASKAVKRTYPKTFPKHSDSPPANAGSIADAAEARVEDFAVPTEANGYEESLEGKDPQIGALLNKLGGSISRRDLTVRGTQMRRSADPNTVSRLRVSDLRALLLEGGRDGLQAGASEDLVQQLAAKYGVSARVLHNVLKYNHLPSRGDSNGNAMDRLGFKSEEAST